VKNFDFFKGLWMTYKNWKINHVKWLNCAWNELDGTEVEDEVGNYKSLLQKSKKHFRTNPNSAKQIEIIDNLLIEIVEFEKFVPLAV
jgi:hypothetical protein